jgi:hypothetical protein
MDTLPLAIPDNKSPLARFGTCTKRQIFGVLTAEKAKKKGRKREGEKGGKEGEKRREKRQNDNDRHKQRS